MFYHFKNEDKIINIWLDQKFEFKGKVTEPSLARLLPKALPPTLPVMLSASSPIRDWISFGAAESFSRRCFGFRGASGIDGTLSLAMGLAIANGPMALITGDLALLHDSNGWLFKILCAFIDTPIFYAISFYLRKKFNLKLGEEISIKIVNSDIFVLSIIICLVILS